MGKSCEEALRMVGIQGGCPVYASKVNNFHKGERISWRTTWKVNKLRFCPWILIVSDNHTAFLECVISKLTVMSTEFSQKVARMSVMPWRFEVAYQTTQDTRELLKQELRMHGCLFCAAVRFKRLRLQNNPSMYCNHPLGSYFTVKSKRRLFTWLFGNNFLDFAIKHNYKLRVVKGLIWKHINWEKSQELRCNTEAQHLLKKTKKWLVRRMSTALWACISGPKQIPWRVPVRKVNSISL